MKKIINSADAGNYLIVLDYLKDPPGTNDVSYDFAPEPDTTVTAWDLLTDTPVYEALQYLAGLGE